MKKNIIHILTSPFGMSLFLGVLGFVSIAIPLFDLWVGKLSPSFQLVMAFFIGSGLGFGVLFIERLRYLRHCLRQHAVIQYKTTSLPKFVYFVLLFGTILNSKSEMGNLIVLASGGYLLTLATILFQIRKNKEIMIS